MENDEEIANHSAASLTPGIPTLAGEAAGETIDRYRLVEQIGEGGMGTVWLAQQSEPIKRQVALKVIKLGMDTREVVLRFEAERQALAMMDHPGIAKVLDGGATKSGRPFFVMELVEGVPITEYCDAAQLGLRERLELFARVCEAIQHAHQKGIIHRDIKPSNVLVAEQDGHPAPKVIDFGIAKATGTDLTQQTMFTQVGQMIGTPEYMAPEQAQSGGLDVDTRADVYSLGVLLYELLTGMKTFDLKSVLDVGYAELLRTIREVDPIRPSTRVSSLGGSATAIAATRRANPTTLSQRLRGDLDWIVMKALEKDREQRYETANGLALDLRRYLDDEPVLAVPPSALYRWRKLVRRRKKTVGAVAVIAVVLLAGAIGTGVGYWRTLQANRALDVSLAAEVTQRELANENAQRAQDAEAEARSEAERAVTAETLARSEAERAVQAEADTRARAAELELVAEFQSAQLGGIRPELMGVRMRRALIGAAPEEQRGALASNLAGINFTSLALGTLEENLFDRTIEAIDTQFADQPLVRASLLQTMANTLLKLGLLERASDPQRRALAIRRAELGDDDELTRTSIADSGVLLQSQGRTDEAERYTREALERSSRLLGRDDPKTLALLVDMATILQDRNELTAAEALLREAVEGFRLAYGDESVQVLETAGNLGGLLYLSGALDEAEPFTRQTLEGFRRLYGDDHPSTLNAINSMGVLVYALGRWEEAEPYLREAVAGRRRVLGDDHPQTLVAVGNLASVLASLDRLEEAEQFTREALEGNRRQLGDEHFNTLILMRTMGGLLERQGKFAEAVAIYRAALETSRRVLGDEHPNTLVLVGSIGMVHYAAGQLEEAAPYFRESCEGMRRNMGDDHPDTLTEIYNLGVVLRKLDKLSDSESLLREVLAGRRRVLGDDHPQTKDANNSLWAVFDRRVELARDAGDELLIGQALARLGGFALEEGRHIEAETVFTEALELMTRTLPETDAQISQVLGNLGAAIAAQGRYSEAEPLVLESVEGMLANAPASAGSADDPMQPAIDFYKAWHAAEPASGHDASADEWRARQESLKTKQAAESGD